VIHRTRPHRAVVLAVLALLAAGCSGSDDTADTADATTTPSTVATTAPPTTDAPTTTAAITTTAAPNGTTAPSNAAAPLPLFASVDAFVARYDADNAAAAEQGYERFELTTDQLVTGPLPSGATGFVAAELYDAGILGGTTGASGEVTSVYVLFDPDGTTAVPALISLLTSTIGSPAVFDITTFTEEYTVVALEAATRAGDQIWSPSINNSGHSIVVTVVAGTEGGDNLIEVAIIPVADEAEAKAAVGAARPALLSLVPS